MRCYIDDIIIFSRSWEDHVDHLRKIFGAVGDGLGSWDLATRLWILEARQSFVWGGIAAGV